MRLALLIASIICLFSFQFENPTTPKDIKFSKALKKKYIYVPEGEVIIGDKSQSVSGFFIFNTEVSNQQYREFLSFLQANDRLEDLAIAQVRDETWDSPIANVYDTHPAYNDYPVVNITHEAATLYCAFLKEALNQSPALKKGKVTSCRLPTQQEWVRAARGGIPETKFPWGDDFVKNSKGKYLANIAQINGFNVTFDSDSERYKFIDDSPQTKSFTCRVESFYPNEFGIYNMSGNVAEMLSKKGVAAGGSFLSTAYDAQIESIMPYDDHSHQVGFRPVLFIAPE